MKENEAISILNKLHKILMIKKEEQSRDFKRQKLATLLMLLQEKYKLEDADIKILKVFLNIGKV